MGEGAVRVPLGQGHGSEQVPEKKQEYVDCEFEITKLVHNKVKNKLK